MSTYYSRIDSKIIELATTRQQEIYAAVASADGNCKVAAELLGVHISIPSATLKAMIKRAAEKGYAPEQGLLTEYPDGFAMKKVTVQRGADGQVERTWERMCADDEKHMEIVIQAVQAVVEGAPVRLPVICDELSLAADENLMVNIPIGDAHIGMFAWAEECGAAWDLELAETVHKQAIDMLLKATPNAGSCTIIDLGDFLHFDNLSGTTARSGNVLDVAGRYHQMIRVAVRLSLYYIDEALKKFPTIIYRPEVGNHNDIGAIWMQELLAVVYANEPRVTIGNLAGNVFYWQHGLCFFGSHHGHNIKGDKLPQIMAGYVMDNHIKTVYRKWYCGHIHHSSVKEYNTCVVQTYNTLAPRDSYSAGHGYNSNRSIGAEVWHAQLGEVFHAKVTIPMIEATDKEQSNDTT